MSSHARTKPVHTPSGGPPQGPRPSDEIFPALGEEGVFRMLADLYAALEQSDVRHLFPEDMQAASRRSAAFFVQLLGGPPLFSQTYGPPRMRQRHLPFEIDGHARAVWLSAFETVLETAETKYGFPPQQLDGFRSFLHSFSSWMVNVAPEQG